MKTIIMILISSVMAAGQLNGQAPEPPPVPQEEQPVVLTRGPMNEAFARPVNIEEEGSLIAPKAPPPNIEEIPPAEAPVGEQFAWIPGYWAWDSDRDEYIWVSGCWRAVPPGKYWVPGYWTETVGGWIWIAGYWATVDKNQIEYLPAPPAVKYIEPVVKEAPDRIWVPPCWYWSHGRYTLRAGYWIMARKDWIWTPSHYVRTPRGYVFVDGYWDYPFRSRGVLFAPVYFPRHIHRRVGFSYSLNIVVDLGGLEFGIFTRPKYRHYYFGDYYDSFYIDIGIFPWFECVTRHTWYDPIYRHDRWRYKRDKHRWRQHVRWEYERRRVNKKLRPPRTYREQEHRKRNVKISPQRSYEVAIPIKKIVKKKTTEIKFQKSKQEDRNRILRNTRDVYRDARNRSQSESPVTVRKAGRTVKKNIKTTDRRVSEFKESRLRNSKVTAPIKKTEEKKITTNRTQKQKAEVKRQVSKPTDNAPKNVRNRSQGKAPGKVTRPENRAINSVQTKEQKKVRTQVERKRADLKVKEKRSSSHLERERLSKLNERATNRPIVTNRQVKPSNVTQRVQKQNKPGSVKVKSSPVVIERESRSSSKRQPPPQVKNRNKKEDRDGRNKQRE